jgi:hypothetical protein
MEENYQKPRKVIRISKKKLIIVVLVLAVLAVWFVNRSPRYYYEDMGFAGEAMQDIPSLPSGEVARMMPDIMPYYDPSVDITDTREFLKTNYAAQIYSRDVPKMVDDVETAVRSVDGRIDGISSSERSGLISFVIAKSDLSEFKDEIEKLTHRKLYTEDITSQNLLAQKQHIEEQTQVAEKTLTQLQSDKQTLDAAHQRQLSLLGDRIRTMQQQLDSTQTERSGLQATDGAEAEMKVAQLVDEESTLLIQIAALQQDLSDEQRVYTAQNRNISSRINRAGGTVEHLAQEDEDFMNDVETVTGYVNVRWISYWDMAARFSPTPMWVNTIVFVFVLWWALVRMRILPKIELV